jgi:hypothetical protein
MSALAGHMRSQFFVPPSLWEGARGRDSNKYQCTAHIPLPALPQRGRGTMELRND